jgi:hypothetical protein
MQRSVGFVAIALGAVAILGLLGAMRGLPAYVGFFAGALAIVLFPGALLSTVAPSLTGMLSLPELLAVWFVLGSGLVGVCGFMGLAFHARVSHLLIALAIAYVCLVVPLVARQISRRLYRGRAIRPPARRLTCLIIFAVAIGAGLLTLITPRDVDDWYYLAYIRDFGADHPLRSEDAIIDMGHPAPPRIWYASWWVVEAMLSRATGVDPVPCHQIYLPVLLAPFAVLAVFMLAKQVFESERAACLGCLLQVLFYLSSAYPYNSAGWLVFCRISQDKALACFVVVPVVVALALRLIQERAKDRGETPLAGGALCAPCDVPSSSPASGGSGPHGAFGSRVLGSEAAGPIGLYGFALVASILIHPLALAWSSVAILPFALVEAVRQRCRSAIATLGMLIVPVLVCGGLVASGMSEVSSELETKAVKRTREAKQIQAARDAEDQVEIEPPVRQPESRQVGWQNAFRFLSFYLPGTGIPWASSKGDFSTTLRHKGEPVIANPSYITRYPLASAGLILTCFLFLYARRSRSARFLLATTLSILVLTFVPGAAVLSARVLTWKLVYRLAWMLPWGLTLGFFVSRVRLRGLRSGAAAWIPSAAIVVLATLGLARGNPANYARSLVEWRILERPQPLAVDALRALGTEPAPQGVILASQGMSSMIPAFLADAYPTTYRGLGTVPRRRLDALLGLGTLTAAAVEEIRQAQCKYILLETVLPLAGALSQADRGQAGQDAAGHFVHRIYENEQYRIWKVAPAPAPVPGRN